MSTTDDLSATLVTTDGAGDDDVLTPLTPAMLAAASVTDEERAMPAPGEAADDVRGHVAALCDTATYFLNGFRCPTPPPPAR